MIPVLVCGGICVVMVVLLITVSRQSSAPLSIRKQRYCKIGSFNAPATLHPAPTDVRLSGGGDKHDWVAALPSGSSRNVCITLDSVLGIAPSADDRRRYGLLTTVICFTSKGPLCRSCSCCVYLFMWRCLWTLFTVSYYADSCWSLYATVLTHGCTVSTQV
jgi:hypothetical protein